MSAPTDDQVQIMRHALGLDRQAYSYRNHYAVTPEADTFADVVALVDLGLMAWRGLRCSPPLPGCRGYATVTRAGAAAVVIPELQSRPWWSAFIADARRRGFTDEETIRSLQSCPHDALADANKYPDGAAGFAEALFRP